MATLHTNPATLAAALRRAADDIDAMGDVTLSGVNLQVNLQAVKRMGTDDERKATVDALGRALVQASGDVDPGSDHYAIPYEATYVRSDADVAVYAGLDERAPAEGGAS